MNPIAFRSQAQLFPALAATAPAFNPGTVSGCDSILSEISSGPRIAWQHPERGCLGDQPQHSRSTLEPQFQTNSVDSKKTNCSDNVIFCCISAQNSLCIMTDNDCVNYIRLFVHKPLGVQTLAGTCDPEAGHPVGEPFLSVVANYRRTILPLPAGEGRCDGESLEQESHVVHDIGGEKVLSAFGPVANSLKPSH